MISCSMCGHRVILGKLEIQQIIPHLRLVNINNTNVNTSNTHVNTSNTNVNTSNTNVNTINARSQHSNAEVNIGYIGVKLCNK